VSRIIVAVLAIVFVTLNAGNAASDSEQARQILDVTQVRGGLVVHIGCGDGKLTAALRANDGYLVHGLDTDIESVSNAREYLHSLGAYGSVSVERLGDERLPHIDNSVNLVVSEDLGRVSLQEIMRTLVPGGVAYIKDGNAWKKTTKPRPEEMDEWTHFLHDSKGGAVAHDSLVAPPRHLQWVGSPRWGRHHDHMPSVMSMVSAGGRVFYIIDEAPAVSIQLPPQWSLVARDVFNGVVLWKRPIESWHNHLWPFKSGPIQLARRLVAVDDKVYVPLGFNAPLSALDSTSLGPRCLCLWHHALQWSGVRATPLLRLLHGGQAGRFLCPGTGQERGARDEGRARADAAFGARSGLWQQSALRFRLSAFR
jgi:SAM-dependent methyltransferase